MAQRNRSVARERAPLGRPGTGRSSNTAKPVWIDVELPCVVAHETYGPLKIFDRGWGSLARRPPETSIGKFSQTGYDGEHEK
jgi:hypothetical protein